MVAIIPSSDLGWFCCPTKRAVGVPTSILGALTPTVRVGAVPYIVRVVGSEVVTSVSIAKSSRGRDGGH